MLVVGITSSFGCGKTTVANIFKGLGAEIIDADALAREVLERREIQKKLFDFFGKSILKGVNIDREKLAEQAFESSKSVKKLNAIMHPPIIKEIKSKIKSFEKKFKGRKKIVVLDAPLLIEAGILDLADFLIVVKCSKAVQMKRIKKYKKLQRKDALKRINAQKSLKEKIELADFIVDSNGSIKNTKKQVEAIHHELKTMMDLMEIN